MRLATILILFLLISSAALFAQVENATIGVSVGSGNVVSLGDVSAGVLATGVNSTYVNITMLAYYVTTGSPAQATFWLAIGNVTSTGSVVVCQALGSYTVSGAYTVIASVPSGCRAVLWNVTANGAALPGPGALFYVPIALPQTSLPQPIAPYVGLIAAAVAIALGGRYSLRAAGIGFVLFGFVVIPALYYTGASTPQVAAAAAASWLMGLLLLGLSTRIEQSNL